MNPGTRHNPEKYCPEDHAAVCRNPKENKTGLCGALSEQEERGGGPAAEGTVQGSKCSPEKSPTLPVIDTHRDVSNTQAPDKLGPLRAWIWGAGDLSDACGGRGTTGLGTRSAHTSRWQDFGFNN